VVPPTERNQDPERDRSERELARESARPLTDDEKKAADRDAPAGERVYAPATARVPVEPVPGHREMIEHTDTATPERAAATSSTLPPTAASMPSERGAMSAAPTPDPYASPLANPALRTDPWTPVDTADSGRRQKLFAGLGVALLGAGVGIWALLRWRAERDKPLNRFKRQARQTAVDLRGQMPRLEDAARPAMGLTTAAISLLALWWQESQSRARRAEQRLSRGARKGSRRAAKRLSDAEWQARLEHVKARWNPARLAAENVPLPRR
jgi:hypothetical protein